MEKFIKMMDDLPLIVKIILAIPMLDIIWNVYRLCRSIEKKNTLGIVLGIVVILFLSWNIVAIFDIIFIILKNTVWWID